MIPLPTPSVPTDNLYKFTAVFGLVLVMFGLAYPLFLYKERVELLTQTRKEFLADVQTSLKTALDIYYQDPAKEDSQKKKDLELLHKTFSEGAIQAIGDRHQNAFDAQVKVLQSMELMAQILLWIGAFISTVGFGLWYFRVQKPMDQQLQRQLKAENLS